MTTTAIYASTRATEDFVELTMLTKHRGHKHIVRSRIYSDEPFDSDSQIDKAREALEDSLRAQIVDDIGT